MKQLLPGILIALAVTSCNIAFAVKAQAEHNKAIAILTSELRRKPMVIIPEVKHCKIKFSKTDDTLYVYPVVDPKW